MKSFLKRTGLLILLFLCAMVLPWYVTLGIAFVIGFFVQNFFEIIALGIFYDVLFYSPSLAFYQVIMHTAISCVLFLLIVVITKITTKPKIFI